MAVGGTDCGCELAGVERSERAKPILAGGIVERYTARWRSTSIAAKGIRVIQSVFSRPEPGKTRKLESGSEW